MNLSLNEVEATAKKATRGAGYPWGLAEEAGKAVRWLCARDVDGCAALADLLGQIDGSELDTPSPRTGSQVWHADKGALCPLLAGTAISDGIPDLQAGSLQLDRVAAPMLLLPFAAMVALRLKTSVWLEWDQMRAATDGKKLSLDGTSDSGTVSVHMCLRGGTHVQSPQPERTRADPDDETLEALNRLAHRTYAPATEDSRLKGAGAGLSDND
jgi:hypothetical protein